MPKDQFRETDVARKISTMTFGMDSAESMQAQSYLQVVSPNLYNKGQGPIPVPHGLLDKRLGTSSKGSNCQTCGKLVNECVGHFGYYDLITPVFHIGYVRSIITVLQTICKSCSRVMLDNSQMDEYRSSFENPNISYMAKKLLRKKLIDKCKKVKKCPHCKAINGFVKRLTTKTGRFLKIVHEKYKGTKESVTKNKLDQLNGAITRNPELAQAADSGNIPEVLTAEKVLELFENIPDEDIPLLAMNPERSKPKDMILTRLLIPPATIRPSVASSLKAGTTEDDLTSRLSEIIFISMMISKKKSSGQTANLYRDDWDYLQLVTSLYINSELSGVPSDMMSKLSKRGRGLVQRLKGKQGRFRGNLSGKRVDFSSRTVISPDPNLQIDQVGVPEHVAKILTYPEYVTQANISLVRQLVVNGPDKWPGANYVEQKNSKFEKNRKFLKFCNREKLAQELKLGDLVERHLLDNDIALFNRQPSLHKLSIMALKVKVHTKRTFRFNECVCNPFNADFDGDEMNLHVPQTEEAKAESYMLLGNWNNLVTPRNGELLIAATQDFLTGAFVLSRKDKFVDKVQAIELITQLVAGDDSKTEIDLPPPCIMKPIELWSGKQIISAVFKLNNNSPVKANLEAKGKSYTKNREFCVSDSYVIMRNSELLAGTLDKSHLGSGTKGSNAFFVILRNFGEAYAIKCMWRLARLSSYFLMNEGFSIGIGDVTPQRNLLQKKYDLLDKGYSNCDGFIKMMKNGVLQCEPGCDQEETLEAIMLKELSTIRETAGKACIDALPPTNSPLIMAVSGSKGSIINISQMIACVGQQALNGKRVPDGFDGRSLPYFEHFSKSPAAKGFVENSFYSALTPTEFWFHTMGGREGLVDTAVKTAETGYMQRRLVKSLEDLVVQYDGTVRNAEQEVVQIKYGCDGLDPTYMEGKDCPVDFETVLQHIRAKFPYRDEPPLDGKSIRLAAKECIDGTGVLDECSDSFKNELRNFMEKVAVRVDNTHNIYKERKGAVAELERLTCKQLVTFMDTCGQKYIRAVVEPGTAVGALAAQSIGEPGTQMTLKTFHFAGVASMNITQGVPRVKEIINATKRISTPVIRATLTNSKDLKFARRVKARIEITTLGQVTSFMKEVHKGNDCFILIKLDHDRIQALQLEVNAETVRYSICTSKLKLKPNEVEAHGLTLLKVIPDTSKHTGKLNYALGNLMDVLPDVIIKGLPTVSRAVIAIDDKNTKEKDDETKTYSLLVEGDNFGDVIATYGIDGRKTSSNNIMEVYKTLGIEAARQTIMSEIKMVMENHGMSIDYRHIMLLAAQMTHTGKVLGITRQGLSEMKQSVLNLASFEKTADHLFDAAYYGQQDKIAGVSESIIMGMTAPIGTGLINLLNKPTEVDKNPQSTKQLLFETTVNS